MLEIGSMELSMDMELYGGKMVMCKSYQKDFFKDSGNLVRFRKSKQRSERTKLPTPF